MSGDCDLMEAIERYIVGLESGLDLDREAKKNIRGALMPKTKIA